MSTQIDETPRCTVNIDADLTECGNEAIAQTTVGNEDFSIRVFCCADHAELFDDLNYLDEENP